MIPPEAFSKLTERLPPRADVSGVQALLEASTLTPLSPQQVLVRAGDTADTLMLVLEGRLKVALIDDEGRETVVSSLGPGDFIGEFAVFDGGDTTRSAWVIARTQARVAVIGYDAFHDLALRHPCLLLMIGAQLVGRLKATTRKLGDMAFLEDAVLRTLGLIVDAVHDLGLAPDGRFTPDDVRAINAHIRSHSFAPFRANLEVHKVLNMEKDWRATYSDGGQLKVSLPQFVMDNHLDKLMRIGHEIVGERFTGEGTDFSVDQLCEVLNTYWNPDPGPRSPLARLVDVAAIDRRKKQRQAKGEV